MKKACLYALLFGLLCTGCDALDEAKKLKAQLEYAQKHIYALRGELESASGQLKNAIGQLDKAHKEIRTLRIELDDVKQKYAQAQAQLEENQRLYKQMLE